MTLARQARTRTPRRRDRAQFREPVRDQLSTSEGHASTPQRLGSMDALRALLVVWIIAGHALLGYSAYGGWLYDQVAEVKFTSRVELTLAALIGPTGLFLMGTFFLIAGSFTSVSLARIGPSAFLRRRVLRLGLPFAVTVVLIWPATVWVAYRSTGRSLPYDRLAGGGRLLHSGALWFVEVLLIFSAAYLLLRLLFGPPAQDLTLRGRHLVLLAVAIAVASFVLRLWHPIRSAEPADLHLWEWPALAGMFALGTAGGLQMATRVPDRIARGCGLTVLVTLLSLPVMALLANVHDLAAASPPYLGGAHWQAAQLAIVEATLTVAGSVWLVGMAQRHFSGAGEVVTRADRASYAAFVLQNPILVGLAVALRPLSAPAEVKAPIVAVLGVCLCLLIGHLLVTRSPLRRSL